METSTSSQANKIDQSNDNDHKKYLEGWDKLLASFVALPIILQRIRKGKNYFPP